MFHILHCPLSGPDLIYISPPDYICIIEYVMNKNLESLNLEKRLRGEGVRVLDREDIL